MTALDRLIQPKGDETMTLTREGAKELEAKYGKHKFCHQSGNPNIVWESPAEGAWCPKCGSSDQDE